MDAAVVDRHYQYSVRLLQPFVPLLRESGCVPEPVLSFLMGLDADQRIDAKTVNAMLDGAVQLTGDALLGLKACARIAGGDMGVFDYVTSSAGSVRAALEAGARYMRLLNDALDFSLEVDGERVIALLGSWLTVPQAAEDFMVCGLIRTQAPSWPAGMADDLDVWLRHEAPLELTPYREVLGAARLHFSSDRSGFGFASRYLDAPLPLSNLRLHEVLRHYADGSLAELPCVDSLVIRVRRFVVDHLTTGAYGLDEAARAFGMSPRTFGRRLADEGATFKVLVDDIRREVSLRTIAGHDLGLSEVALLAGFSDTSSFHRAFRRWTGTTPKQYRWERRGDLRGLR